MQSPPFGVRLSARVIGAIFYDYLAVTSFWGNRPTLWRAVGPDRIANLIAVGPLQPTGSHFPWGANVYPD